MRAEPELATLAKAVIDQIELFADLDETLSKAVLTECVTGRGIPCLTISFGGEALFAVTVGQVQK